MKRINWVKSVSSRTVLNVIKENGTLLDIKRKGDWIRHIRRK